MDAKERGLRSMIEHWLSVYEKAELSNNDYLANETLKTIVKAYSKYEEEMGKPYSNVKEN